MILRFLEFKLCAPHRNAVSGCGRLRAELENASEIKILSPGKMHSLTARSAPWETRKPGCASSGVFGFLLRSMPQGEEKANLNRAPSIRRVKSGKMGVPPE